MAANTPICQALRLDDSDKCQNKATRANGLFCQLHAKQAYGLYKGYKQRNAKVDASQEEAPTYIKESQVPLANETFKSLEDRNTLDGIYHHLFHVYALLGNVIEARKMHHKYFYPLQMDYGHQAYLDKLRSQRNVVLHALGALTKRIGLVLYENEQWYSWARDVQKEEESTREKEKKKVKQEAALFKRQMKALEARMAQIRQNEDQKRQDEFLERAFQERMHLSEDDSDVDDSWNPLQDVQFDQRQLYIDLIKHFLWIHVLNEEDPPAAHDHSIRNGNQSGEVQATGRKPKKKSKGKSAAAETPTATNGQMQLLVMEDPKAVDSVTIAVEPEKNSDKDNGETEEAMKARLSRGELKNYGPIWGFRAVGTPDQPAETAEKLAPMADGEINSMINDIKEIYRESG